MRGGKGGGKSERREGGEGRVRGGKGGGKSERREGGREEYTYTHVVQRTLAELKWICDCCLTVVTCHSHLYSKVMAPVTTGEATLVPERALHRPLQRQEQPANTDKHTHTYIDKRSASNHKG